MASRYASAAAVLVVAAAVFQATSAAYIVPEGEFFSRKFTTVFSDYQLLGFWIKKQ